MVSKEAILNIRKATIRDNPNLIQKCLDKGECIDSRSAPSGEFEGGLTALHFAIMFNKLQAMQYLLDKGANINALDQEDQAPLTLAIKQNNMTMVCVLLRKGANINHKDDLGRSALHFSAMYGRLNILYMLLSLEKADINTRTNLGETPLFIAQRNGNIKVIKLIEQNGGIL
jgi:ankyrin repeat protein